MTSALGTPSAPLRILQSLQSRQFRIDNEKRLQAQIAEAFAEDGIEAEREVRLSPTDVIDFLIGDIGLEAKIKGQRRAIFRQCVRYCRHDAIGTLIVATSVAMGFPVRINGKSVYVVSLGRAWLA